jgi:carboxyl-terminal processing protease
VLDLRRNGGGSLEEAINLTGLFIHGGPVVQTRDTSGRVEVGRARASSQIYDGPLVVLISRFSASASEIAAGALQDYGRAVIVGDSSTFGKGTVQTMIPLDHLMQREGLAPAASPGALKITISKFYRPSGQSTQLAGVKSDIVLPSPSDTPEIGETELENPLPWDTIPAARYTFDDRVTPYLPGLQTRSAARIAQDPEFRELRQSIAAVRKQRETKTVSLNEDERKKEKAESDARAKALKKESEEHAAHEPPTWELTLKNIDQPGLGEPLKHKKSPDLAMRTPSAAQTEDPTLADDLLLGEAEHILSDYVDALNGAASPLAGRP